ncbi:UNVERIFIED_CONTAM: hypothetical protein Sindi_1172400, partial [Sesamum indicum]
TPQLHRPTAADDAGRPYRRARLQADGSRRCGQPLPTCAGAGGRQQTGARAGSPCQRARARLFGDCQALPTCAHAP